MKYLVGEEKQYTFECEKCGFLKKIRSKKEGLMVSRLHSNAMHPEEKQAGVIIDIEENLTLCEMSNRSIKPDKIARTTTERIFSS